MTCSVAGLAEVDEYEFFSDFIRWVYQQPPELRGNRAILIERYRTKLAADGVGPAEIDRRVRLIEKDGAKHFWNRFFAEGKGVFNQEPNAFLVECIKGRKPGAALDVGMGQGRNAIYLAQNGWQTTGIDPADKAVEIARKRAAELGLKLEAVAVRDNEYDFGDSRWDLVLFSWYPPDYSYEKAIRSLRPAGIIIVEGPADELREPNAVLRMFDSLRIVKYEVVRTRADFYNRREMNVFRLLAEKSGR